MRLAIAAAAMWAILAWRRETLALPREAWSAIVLLALLNNALPFTLFGWPRLTSPAAWPRILNATTPIWA